ncbi:MAG: EscS/YscS/HrcS family type III secretion system export apparatus protein [Phyllobacteriaceae bacterium]|nr:EscS/YscS/HrcS family type III secretion system export apparatus protein [Phyllobacteriaceae bacterium]
MNSAIAQQLYESSLAMLAMAGPILVVAALIGFFMALFQAATQIQDQTLPQILKMVVIAAMVVLGGAMLAGPMVRYTENLFINFPRMIG